MSADRHFGDEFPEHADLPLRDRLPDYLAIWGVGAAAAAIVGAVINGVEGVGYVLLFLGIGFLLFGGATGGGYTNWGPGALARMFGRSIDDDDPDQEEPQKRLRKLPEPNPQAFWSVVGGFAYVAIGFWLLG